MSQKNYIAGKMSAPLARRVVQLEYPPPSQVNRVGKTVLEMRALGLIKSLTRLLRLRQKRGDLIGNLAGWINVCGDVAAGLNAEVRMKHVEAICVRIGISVDPAVISMVAKRVAAARRSEGAGFQIMTPELVGKHVELTARERQELRITNIGSVDESPADRRKRLDRERKLRVRAGRGSKPRPSSPGDMPPWKVKGMSKSTYYARKCHLGLNVLGSIKNGKADIQSEFPGKADVQSSKTADVQSSDKLPIEKADIQSSRGAEVMARTVSNSLAHPPKSKSRGRIS